MTHGASGIIGRANCKCVRVRGCSDTGRCAVHNAAHVRVAAASLRRGSWRRRRLDSVRRAVGVARSWRWRQAGACGDGGPWASCLDSCRSPATGPAGRRSARPSAARASTPASSPTSPGRPGRLSPQPPRSSFAPRRRRRSPDGPATWSIALEGGRGPARVSIDELRAASRPMGAHLIECAGNNNPDNFGLMSVAEWDGVPLAEVVRPPWRTAAGPTACSSRAWTTRRSRRGHRMPGASWVLPWTDLEARRRSWPCA